MVKIILEKLKCIGCGACQAVCQKYFEIGEDGKSHIIGTDSGSEKEELEVEKTECAQQAKEGCPAECIHIEK